MTEQHPMSADNTKRTGVVDNSNNFALRTPTAMPPLVALQARQLITPFLPPPLVVALRQVDTRLEPYLGREASMNLLATIVVGLLVMYLVRSLVGGRQRGTRRAWAEDNEDDERGTLSWRADVDYGSTMILCGPSGGGKTSLFYQLCPGSLPLGQSLTAISTLTSLRPNLGLTTPTNPNQNDNQTNPPPLRVIDYPGSLSLQDESFLNWLFPKSSSSPPTRVILVLDSSQRVNAAAEILFQLLELAAARQPQSLTLSSSRQRLAILIACHKADAAQAKNWRRIKLQLRTELERRFSQPTTMDDVDIRKERHNGHLSSNPSWWWPKLSDKSLSAPWDLEQLPIAQISFCATSCRPNATGVNLTELLGFCTAGTDASASPTAN